MYAAYGTYTYQATFARMPGFFTIPLDAPAGYLWAAPTTGSPPATVAGTQGPFCTAPDTPPTYYPEPPVDSEISDCGPACDTGTIPTFSEAPPAEQVASKESPLEGG